MKRLPPRILAISDRRLLVGGSNGGPTIDAFERWLTDLGTAGVEAVQVREKGASDRQVLAWTRLAVRSRSAATPGPGTVLVNGRLDLACAANADGVHLPVAEASAARLRTALDPTGQCLIGRSTHSVAEVEQARDEGADYVTFGPVYETPSKAVYGPPPGLAGLAAAVAVGLPVLALGGITPERVPEVAAAGAWGVAAIRSLHEPGTRRALVAACRSAWGAAGESAR